MKWSVNDRPVLHWPDDPDWSDSAKIRGGNPLLFPFIARTYLDGKIGKWRDPEGVVRPAPMHGLVRAAAFEAVETEEARIAMRIAWDESMAEAYPFPFEFGVEYVLEDNSLEAVFTIENTGKRPMPFSVGNHFYFHVPAEERTVWTIDCPCRRWARQDDAGRIVSAPPPGGNGSLGDPSQIDLFHIGPARSGVRLRHPGDGRRVLFDLVPDKAGRDPWYAVTTWTQDKASDFFCIEPWTALPDAMHNRQGLRWLDPGERESLRLRLTAENW